MRKAMIAAAMLAATAATAKPVVEGRWFRGEGESRPIQMLDTAARMLFPSPELQDISMLYAPAWNGFVEGPTWDAWWIQNSLGPSYAGMPFFEEPYAGFVRNAQALWFGKQADGVRKDANGWQAPDGCLCDAANQSVVYYRQGDGRVAIHDWCFGFTIGGILLESERLLVTRDPAQIAERLPQLERAAAFVDSRRDPATDLYLGGPAANLLAPSHAGARAADGSYAPSYLAELSVNFIAALSRLIEVERMAGRDAEAARWTEVRAAARRGLPRLLGPDGCFVKSIDRDGTKHGVMGAEKHGYFEAVVNHDAVAWRVVGDAQAKTIVDRMAAIPGLRPHGLIITNYPSLDDMYDDQGLFAFGTWVNGGHWTTCEARMILAYLRVGRWKDAMRSMDAILKFARGFRMDNPLTRCGGALYQPNQPVNTVYDSWGAPTGLLRGLFEYLYTADGLTLVPHMPPGVTHLEQRLPVVLGSSRLLISVTGSGPITGLRINGHESRAFTASEVRIRARGLPALARVEIVRGRAKARGFAPGAFPEPPCPQPADPWWRIRDSLGANQGVGLPLRIAADTLGGSRFQGVIRRARIFARALGDAEVAALAADPMGASPAGVRADYRLADLNEGRVANAAGDGLEAKAEGAPAHADGGLRFDGESYLDVPSAPGLVLGPRATLEAMICPGETKGRIIDRAIVGGTSEYMMDLHPGNTLRLVSDAGALSASVRLEPGRWVHVAAVIDPSGENRLFVDGMCVARAKGTAPEAAGTAPVALGRVGAFRKAMLAAGQGATAPALHARLVLERVAAARERARLRAAGALKPLSVRTQTAADQLYVDATERLAAGLRAEIDRLRFSTRPIDRRAVEIWDRAMAP